ncbi:LuxQ periplasmic sensor domain-containing protein [Thaumasiovibrio sp. DFM-14]|uniref:LuxQ periplasmic sensor domain-containing protein n=1 Tax=Thaumasiovibrio sp. DFM-14 TaxID=3384792 RepID=UPI0039A2F92B
MKNKKKPQSLSSLIIRLFFVGYSLLTLAIITQSYHFSVNSINSEIERSLNQTSHLLQNIINYRLAALKSSQEANAYSQDLLNYLQSKNMLALDDLFFALEENNSANSPDFRFISKDSELIWHDGASYFHGIDEHTIANIINQVNLDSKWHYIRSDGLLDPVDLLVRRTAIIDRSTGKIVAELNIAVVLNNNLSLLNDFRSASSVESIFLVHGTDVVATNLKKESDEYKHAFKVLSATDTSFLSSRYLVNISPFNIDGETSPIQFLTLDKSDNISLLKEQFSFSAIASLFVVVTLLIFSRHHIKNRILDSLNTLMNYTRSATQRQHFKPFGGTPITEFNQIGSTLQSTLSTLVEKERSLDDLFKIALSPTIVWDCNYQIQRINPAAKEQFEYDKNAKQPTDTFNAFELQIRTHLDAARDGETIRGVHTNVNNTIYHWNLAPLIIDNKVISIIGQAQDITTLIEAKRQSRRAQLAAEAATKAKSDFLAQMSHELRTPLNGILGIAQILKNSLENQQHRDHVDVLYQSGEHLLTVLNDIIDYSQIEQGDFKLKFANFSFKEVIGPITEIYRPLCEKKHLTLLVHNELDEHVIYNSDKSRIVQVLFNLMSNAVKFTQRGKITIRIWREGENTHFSVEDTGIGINNNYLDELFNPFSQADPSATRKYGGSGLGLTIVNKLITLLEGELTISSKQNIGTQFCFWIPMREISTTTHAKQPTLSSPTPEFNLRVLLVEDDKTNALIAKMFCKRVGISVDWVENGKLAVEHLKHHQFDLILMDNHMPVMGGIEAARIIREELKIQTPIYACTADALDETRTDFMSAGANYIIIKPIKNDNFIKALEHFKMEQVSS